LLLGTVGLGSKVLLNDQTLDDMSEQSFARAGTAAEAMETISKATATRRMPCLPRALVE
jgi:hypothetical protein